MSSDIKGKIMSPVIDIQTLKALNEATKIQGPIQENLLDDFEDQSLIKDLNFAQRAFPTALDDVFTFVKYQHITPMFKEIHVTTEADFEKNIVYSSLDYPDSFMVEEGARNEKHIAEFLETAGFSYLRLFIHQKVEGFNFGSSNRLGLEKDIFEEKNIAEYCPKKETELLVEQQSQTITAISQQPKSSELTPKTIEELTKLMKKHGIDSELFGPKLECKIDVLKALETALK